MLNIATADSMRSELQGRLLDMIKWRRQFHESRGKLESIGVELKYDAVFLASAVESVLSSYFTTLCTDLTQQYANNTPAEVVLNPELFTFCSDPVYRESIRQDDKTTLNTHFRRTLVHSDKADTTELSELVDQILSRIDFDCISCSIHEQVKSLPLNGLRIMADSITSDLNMCSKRNPVRVTTKRIIFTIDSTSYLDNHRDIHLFNSILRTLNTIESMAEVNFGSGFSALVKAINNFDNSNSFIPTGTVFGKNEALEIRCYNGKYTLRFSYSAFDSLHAWISLHGGVDSINKIVLVNKLLRDTA